MVLKELCALRGVSGCEAAVREYILDKLSGLDCEVRLDRMGNVIAHKPCANPEAKKVALTAHMDEVGLLIVGINENGLLSYHNVGNIDPRCVVSKPVRVGKNAIAGVIGAKAIHLQSAGERKQVLSHDELYIDIGADSADDAKAVVKVGDYVSFESEWVEFGNGLVKSRALDNRVGCAILLGLLENDYPCDITAVFTVQEEIGARGSKAAAYYLDSDIVIAFEGTSANDLGCSQKHLQVCRLGEGAAVSFMDRASIGTVKLYHAMIETARKNGIAWQEKRFVAGINDAGSFQNALVARSTVVLSVPCRNIHTPSSVCALQDVESTYCLADAFLSGGAIF